MRSLLPRVAAGSTALLVGLAIQRTLIHGWADATMWIIAAALSYCWWSAERRASDAFNVGKLAGRLQGLPGLRKEADRG